MKKIVLGISMGCFLFPAMMKAQETKDRYMHKTASFEITLLAESQGEGNSSILIDATPDMMQAYAADGTFPNAMNAFLVKKAGKNILVDAGLGQKLTHNLQASGVHAGEVDVVLITHMHGDHIGGLLKDGRVVFPNAELYISRPEHDYWMAGEGSRFQRAQEVISAYKDKLHLYQPAQLGDSAKELVPGFTAIAAYGHTPGHTMFLVGSDKDKMLIWGDLTHAMALQMPHPEVAVTYDVDPKEAVVSRKAVLKYVAENNIPIAGMHIAYPSMGTVKKATTRPGYEFVPFY